MRSVVAGLLYCKRSTVDDVARFRRQRAIVVSEGESVLLHCLTQQDFFRGDDRVQIISNHLQVLLHGIEL